VVLPPLEGGGMKSGVKCEGRHFQKIK